MEPHLTPKTRPRSVGWPVLLGFSTLWIAACSGTEGVGGPDNKTDTETSVSQVNVTSPIGAFMAKGRTLQLTATAVDADGAAVSGASVSWSSSDGSVATVSSTGLVTGVAAGNTSISATSETKTGAFGLTVVDADLTGIQSALGDPFADALTAKADATAAAAIQSALTNCNTTLAAGDVTGVQACLAAVRQTTGAPGDADDTALFAVLDLFVDHAELLLGM